MLILGEQFLNMNSKQTFPFLQPLFLLIVFISQFASVQLACPTNYIKIADRCYHFSWTETTGYYLNFDEAREYCQKSTVETYTYDLFVISDFEEFSLITAELNAWSMASSPEIDVFVGAYNAGTNISDWYWVDGTELAVNDNLWHCSSPYVYDAAVLHFDKELSSCYTFGEWRLMDANSTESMYYICEGPPYDSDTSEQLACPGDYTQLNDRCYLFSIVSNNYTMMQFHSARDVCRSTTIGLYNYDLLIISHDEEYAFVTAELSHQASYGAFVGALQLDGDTPSWYWVDGTSLSLNDPLWQCYYPFQSGSDIVAFLYFTDDYLTDCYTFGTWRLLSIPNTDYQHFVCEGPAFPENVLKEAESYWKQLEAQ